MKKLMIAVLCGAIGLPFGFAQEVTPTPASANETDKASLEKNASSNPVDTDLNEPDGISLAMADDGSYQVFARGTGTYDFDDEDDRQEALQEATLKAKANLSKFLSEKIASDESLESLSKKVKTLSKNGDVTTAAVSKEQVKTTGASIRNSSQAILTGAITLATKRIPGAGDAGTYQVTIGVSSKTIKAAEEISNNMTGSLNNRRKVVGDGSNVGGSGAATSSSAGVGSSDSAGGKKPGENNTPEVRKAKTIF